ncbi:MAG: hypothetical protein JSS75_01885 [Bacteroidetes bacterium]|nr:hypothetical protein [Bacteroidota bacterium]
MKEQLRLVEHLDSIDAESRRLALLYVGKLHTLEELKKSILKKAFSGEL